MVGTVRQQHPPGDSDTYAKGLCIRKYRRYWAVYDPDGTLVVVTAYKKGAEAVVRRLTKLPLTLPVPLIRKEGDDPS